MRRHLHLVPRLLYRGMPFRKLLDVELARWFDLHRVPWVYPEAPSDAGFFLPGSRQFVVIRGLRTAADDERLLKFARSTAPRLVGPAWGREADFDDELAVPDLPVIVVGPDGSFHGLNREGRTQREAVAGYIALCHCVRCDGWWFCDAWHSWVCQCCRHYDGNADVDPMLYSPLPEWPTQATEPTEEVV